MNNKNVKQKDIDIFLKRLEDLEDVKLTQKQINDLNLIIRDCIKLNDLQTKYGEK